MRIHSAGVMSAALVLGLAGSVVAYRSQVAEGPAADPAADKPAAVTTSQAPQPVKPVTRSRWAPCPKDSQLERGVCVTDVVRTVVVPVAPVSVPAPVSSAAAAAAVSGHDDNDDNDDEYKGHDDGDDDGDDEYEEHDDGDDGDDHGGDDHDEDDDQDEDDD